MAFTSCATGLGQDTETEMSNSLLLLREQMLGLHHRAVAHWGMGMYETAARELEEILSAFPDRAAVHANLAMVRLRQRRYADAIQSLERALELAPESPRIHYLLGRGLLEAGRPEQAMEHLKKAAELDPTEPAIPLRLSEAWLALSREKEGESELRRALALRPDYGPALYRLGKFLESRGQKEQAGELLGRFAQSKKVAGRISERCRYDEPVEPPLSRALPVSGPNWLEVRAVGARKGTKSVVTVQVQAGRLVLQQTATDAPVLFRLGDKARVDAVRVEWPDGTHSYRTNVEANQTVLIEEVASRVW